MKHSSLVRLRCLAAVALLFSTLFAVLHGQTPPTVTCPAGSCQPGARAAYLNSNHGEPWGSATNIDAMNAVFGAGNWDAWTFENADAAALISAAHHVIFLEGSNDGGYALQTFLANNLPALEAWVAAGGGLFINCATTNGLTPFDFGFGGVGLDGFVSGYSGLVQMPAHQIFNGPFVPANGDFAGNQFQYGTLTGDFGAVLISDVGTSLAEKKWGMGKVYFGAIILPPWVGPEPNFSNMWRNVLADLKAICLSGKALQADAGTCAATVADASLDATASDDDGSVAELKHDFAAAPSNATLLGATFPVGSTLVTWTATDNDGITSTCQHSVAVFENTPPSAVCPPDMTQNVNANNCTAKVEFSATASDDCTAAPQVSAYPPSGSFFQMGETTVTLRATDFSLNSNTCAFTVTVAPGAELCNDVDDDCNGWVDDGAPADRTFYLDADYDGYGDPAHTTAACLVPSGYVANALDCNDADYYVSPSWGEWCNERDDDCDGTVDEGVQTTFFADADGDGYGDPNATTLACSPPAGYLYNAGDCDDASAYIRPGALEDCTNQTDENCDGILGANNFTIAETHADVFCGSTPDGSISITLAPAQHYPLILWNTGSCCTSSLSNLSHGAYKVTVTNECGTTKTKTIVIKPSETPALQVTMSGAHVRCPGAATGTVSAAPKKGCAGYTYQWSTGSAEATLTGLSGGAYFVTVTDGCGCTQTGSFTVEEPAALGLYFKAVSPLLNGKYWVELGISGGTAPYKFRRSTPTGGFTNWSSSNGFDNVLPGDYTFETRDKNNCTNTISLHLDPFAPRPQAIPAQPAAADFRGEKHEAPAPDSLAAPAARIFPNPNAGVFTVETSAPAAPETVLQIVGASGKTLLEKPADAGATRHEVNAEGLPAGLYFLQIKTASGVVAAEKFVKE